MARGDEDSALADLLLDDSIGVRLARLPRDASDIIKAEFGEDWPRLDGLWKTFARGTQLAPDGRWRLWLIMAGRGFGKTRSGAEWVDAYARAHDNARIALVGATMRDVREVMIEGESGILNLGSRAKPPIWQPTLNKLIWGESGAIATCYSAAEPEGLRGPQFHAAWADELGRWGLDADGAGALRAWTNLQLSLRLGELPQVVATTTPRTTPLMRALLAQRKTGQKTKTMVMSGGPTRANAANMPEAWLAAMAAEYEGTRLARQELEGVYLEDVPGALFTRAMLDRCRMMRAELDESAITRTVIGVDPPAGEDGDACGIIVAGVTGDGVALVLEDASVEHAGPEVWARAVAAAALKWRADRVIAEANNGGAMVKSVLLAAGEGLPVKLVHATKAKGARAEPLLIHYEAGRVRHVGALGGLEDELCGLKAAGKYAGPGRSPDRADACVWALTELLKVEAKGPGVRVV